MASRRVLTGSIVLDGGSLVEGNDCEECVQRDWPLSQVPGDEGVAAVENGETLDTVANGNAVAALLLSGGASRRMGRDKTQLVHEGRTLARRTADLLAAVSATALEVGPGRSGLEFLEEEPAGEGPLAAIAAGRGALRRRGHDGPALVVACDMPFLTRDYLAFLVAFDAESSVVPVVEGRVQPLCARWSRADLDAASAHFAQGDRSLRFLAETPGVVLLEESQWRAHASRRLFIDVDTPEDARRCGLIP